MGNNSMREGVLSGRVIWITGLSGAGKTTLAKALQQKLPGALLLDGDELREALGADGRSFDVQSRKRLAQTYARLAGLLARQGATVIVATISLFHDLHAWNREHLPGYVEVFLDVPEAVRRQRDPKGLYAARVPNMAGTGVQVELPLAPHLRLDGTQGEERNADSDSGRHGRRIGAHRPQPPVRRYGRTVMVCPVRRCARPAVAPGCGTRLRKASEVNTAHVCPDRQVYPVSIILTA